VNQYQQSHIRRRVISLQRIQISLNLMPRVHVRLISSTCVPSNLTLNIWWQTVDRGAPGRGKRWESSLWTHSSVGLWREVPDGHVIPVWNAVIHDGRRRRSWVPGSRIRRAAHDDDRLWVSLRTQELGDHVSTTSYDKSDQRSNATTNWDSIDEYPIIRVSP
jgi:hypothetical protein